MRKVEQQQDNHGFHLNLGEYGRVVWRKKYFLLVPGVGLHFDCRYVV